MEENLKQVATNSFKIAFLGPESTGKTTICQQLAAHYKTNWVPEYARDYLQEKWNKYQQICTPEDLLPIAIGQMKLENEIAIRTNGYLFCDTNLIVTHIFATTHYQNSPKKISKAALKHKYDFYFLTDIDMPWEADDLRDQENERERVFAAFHNYLIEYDKPFIRLSGNANDRLQTAIFFLDELEKGKKLGFSTKEVLQCWHHGVGMQQLEKQLDYYKNGIPPIHLVAPANLKKGIVKWTSDEEKHWDNWFANHHQQWNTSLFIPASGAATRMFKCLIEFVQNYEIGKNSLNKYINENNATEIAVFQIGLEKFPFHTEVLQKTIENYPDYCTFSEGDQLFYFIQTMLFDEVFLMAHKPKGVLPFHRYNNQQLTAVEEHLTAASQQQHIREIHLTISEHHKEWFETIFSKYPDTTISVSYQKTSYDSVAYVANGTPFYKNKQLVFRPGGHGALLHNLNQLQADFVILKNIDNVSCRNKNLVQTIQNRLLAYTAFLQEKIHATVNALKNANTPQDLEVYTQFLQNELQHQLPLHFEKFSFDNQKNYLLDTYNRPLRIAAMVANEGEPGGGPFWVRNTNGDVSLQIVESAQIDHKDTMQQQIAKQATHFNPVLMVCGIKNHESEKFDLQQFTDTNTGFLVEKCMDGQNVVSYEMPGLWNGAMSQWNTLFVEVPLEIFTPVKSINDLLKPAHQPFLK